MPTRHSLAPRTEFIVPAEDVTSERVKAAFRAQALAAHPDRVAAEGGGEEEQRAANVRFQRLQVRRVVCAYERYAPVAYQAGMCDCRGVGGVAKAACV
jgi:DnaJ-class molecular chaperone